MQPIYWTTQTIANLPLETSWLSPEEQTTLASLRFPKRRNDWLLGRWTAKYLLRLVVETCKNSSSSAITIQRTESGAPAVLLNDLTVPGMLTLSHREELGCAAWISDPSLRIGIDLEAIETKPNSFISDYFTPAEIQLVQSLTPAQFPLAASLLWSAKEAVLKALGVGLSIDTREVEIHCPSFSISDNWQPLIITQCPLECSTERALWWRTIKDELVTLAILGDEAKMLPIEYRTSMDLD
jgi:4'-phosphopantetheinyl transferase